MENKEEIKQNGQVHVTYIGNFGNQLFQYFTARVYAEIHKCKLVTDLKTEPYFTLHPPKDFSCTIHSSGKIYVMKQTDFDDSNEIRFYGPGLYQFFDYFQNAIFLNRYQDLIMSYVKCFHIPPLPRKKKENDIVCFVRTGSDFYLEYIHPDYYIRILNEFLIKHPTAEIHVKCYPETGTHHFMQWLTPYTDKSTAYHETSSIEDFYLPFHFNNVICSNSTFHWWSCFFASAHNSKIKLWTPRWFGGHAKWLEFGKFTLQSRDHTTDLYNIRNISIPVHHIFCCHYEAQFREEKQRKKETKQQKNWKISKAVYGYGVITIDIRNKLPPNLPLLLSKNLNVTEWIGSDPVPNVAKNLIINIQRTETKETKQFILYEEGSYLKNPGILCSDGTIVFF